MAGYKNKINWRGILSAVLVCALLIGSVVGIASIFGKDTKSISSGAFSVGSIDANGNYAKSDTSIYTEDLIECQGLSIEPDFEATGTYQVFYYGEDKNFIGATEVMNAEEGVYNKASTFVVAKYCRIMITPDVPTDEDGNVEEDFKIRFYEVLGYANDYNITVSKKQNFKLVNYFVAKENSVDECYVGSVGTELTLSTNEGFSVIEPIDVSGMKEIGIVYESGATQGMWNYFFVDSSGLVVKGGNNAGSLEALKLEVPENAATFVCSYSTGEPFIINQTK